MKVDLLENINQLIRPLAEELNYEIYHIEFVKEDGDDYLRIYIEKDSGAITLSDCEALSRRVSTIMDEVDPIKDPYFLEVSSTGLNRKLFTENHYRRQIGKEIQVKLKKVLNGKRNIKGILKEVNEDSIVLESDNLITIPNDKINSANLEGEI